MLEIIYLALEDIELGDSVSSLSDCCWALGEQTEFTAAPLSVVSSHSEFNQRARSVLLLWDKMQNSHKQSLGIVGRASSILVVRDPAPHRGCFVYLMLFILEGRDSLSCSLSCSVLPTSRVPAWDRQCHHYIGQRYFCKRWCSCLVMWYNPTYVFRFPELLATELGTGVWTQSPYELGMVMCACNPSTGEVEAGRALWLAGWPVTSH